MSSALIAVSACSTSPDPAAAPVAEDIAEPDVAADPADVAVDPPVTKYEVGYIQAELVTNSGRKLPFAVWYPAADGAGDDFFRYLALISSTAVRDAQIADGSFPLVVFSHGNQGLKEQSVFLMEHLARNGYVVASADHVDNTATTYKADQLAVVAAERPGDVSALIDRFETPDPADPTWFGTHIDLTRIGAAGHSFGGYTTLALAGGVVSVSASLKAFCSAEPNKFVCKLIDLESTEAMNYRDERIRAAVPMAPGAFQLFGDTGIAEIGIPTLVLIGGKDEDTPESTEARPVFDALPPPKFLWSLRDADHYIFTDICEVTDLLDALKERFEYTCNDFAPLDIDVGHELINDIVLTFFNRYLLDDTEAAAGLTRAEAEAAHEQITMIAAP